MARHVTPSNLTIRAAAKDKGDLRKHLSDGLALLLFFNAGGEHG